MEEVQHKSVPYQLAESRSSSGKAATVALWTICILSVCGCAFFLVDIFRGDPFIPSTYALGGAGGTGFLVIVCMFAFYLRSIRERRQDEERQRLLNSKYTKHLLGGGGGSGGGTFVDVEAQDNTTVQSSKRGDAAFVHDGFAAPGASSTTSAASSANASTTTTASTSPASSRPSASSARSARSSAATSSSSTSCCCWGGDDDGDDDVDAILPRGSAVAPTPVILPPPPIVGSTSSLGSGSGSGAPLLQTITDAQLEELKGNLEISVERNNAVAVGMLLDELLLCDVSPSQLKATRMDLLVGGIRGMHRKKAQELLARWRARVTAETVRMQQSRFKQGEDTMSVAQGLRERLLQAGRAGDRAATDDVLGELETLDITQDILKETGLGLLVSKLARVVPRAESLLAHWRRIIMASNSAPPATESAAARVDARRVSFNEKLDVHEVSVTSMESTRSSPGRDAENGSAAATTTATAPASRTATGAALATNASGGHGNSTLVSTSATSSNSNSTTATTATTTGTGTATASPAVRPKPSTAPRPSSSAATATTTATTTTTTPTIAVGGHNAGDAEASQEDDEWAVDEEDEDEEEEGENGTRGEERA